jgi:hypothetical protein
VRRRLELTILTIAPIAIAVAAAVLLASRGSGDQEYEADATVLESPEHGPELCLGGVLTSLPPQCGGIPIVGWDWDDVDDEESVNGTTWTSSHVRGTYDGTRFTLTAPPAPAQPPDDDTAPRFRPACDEPEVVDATADGADWEAASQETDGRFSEIPGLVAIWVSDPRGPDYDGPFLGNVIVRPGSANEARTHVRRYWKGALCLVERDQRTAKELEADFARLDDVLTQTILTAHVDYQRGVIDARINVVDDQARREVDKAFGPGVVVLTGALKPV